MIQAACFLCYFDDEILLFPFTSTVWGESRDCRMNGYFFKGLKQCCGLD